ncbi:ZN383 protein, partial [Illadopsis cleaveri]|nr:ZN383 protein [Illadopsis cleaveri]
ETFRWTVVRQIRPENSEKRQKNGRKTPKTPNLADFGNVIVLQKSYECSECGKSFGCGSHFAKHRRTHTG